MNKSTMLFTTFAFEIPFVDFGQKIAFYQKTTKIKNFPQKIP